MKKYTLIFSLSYFVLALVAGAITEWLQLKIGTGVGISTTIAASFMAAWQFTKDHNRQPTLEEKKTYAWQALMGVWIVSLLILAVIFAVFLSPRDIEPLFYLFDSTLILAIGAGLTVFISFIYYVVIRWSFAWYAKTAFKKKMTA